MKPRRFAILAACLASLLPLQAAGEQMPTYDTWMTPLQDNVLPTDITSRPIVSQDKRTDTHMMVYFFDDNTFLSIGETGLLNYAGPLNDEYSSLFNYVTHHPADVEDLVSDEDLAFATKEEAVASALALLEDWGIENLYLADSSFSVSAENMPLLTQRYIDDQNGDLRGISYLTDFQEDRSFYYLAFRQKIDDRPIVQSWVFRRSEEAFIVGSIMQFIITKDGIVDLSVSGAYGQFVQEAPCTLLTQEECVAFAKVYVESIGELIFKTHYIRALEYLPYPVERNKGHFQLRPYWIIETLNHDPDWGSEIPITVYVDAISGEAFGW